MFFGMAFRAISGIEFIVINVTNRYPGYGTMTFFACAGRSGMHGRLLMASRRGAGIRYFVVINRNRRAESICIMARFTVV